MASASTTEVFLDTSAWVALALNHVGHRRLHSKSLTASGLAMAELACLVERGRAPPKVLHGFLEAVRLEMPTADDLLAAGILHGRLRRQGNQKVSLSDCTMYQTARRLGLPFVTHDHDLAGQAGVQIL